MPNTDPANWQPISQMPLIVSMINGALDDTREHLATLGKARTRPHVLDDATIDRSERVHTEQLEFIDIYVQQISRWRKYARSADQRHELDRMEAQNGQLRAATADVLALASELRQGTIERVMSMSDLELSLQALLRSQRPGRREPDRALNRLSACRLRQADYKTGK